MLRVKLPAGTPQPDPGDASGALQALAGAIRRATAAFRGSPEEQLKAMADTEALVGAPALHTLSWLAANRMPLLTCTTNYVPAASVRAWGVRGGHAEQLLAVYQPATVCESSVRLLADVACIPTGWAAACCRSASYACRL